MGNFVFKLPDIGQVENSGHQSHCGPLLAVELEGGTITPNPLSPNLLTPQG